MHNKTYQCLERVLLHYEALVQQSMLQEGNLLFLYQEQSKVVALHKARLKKMQDDIKSLIITH